MYEYKCVCACKTGKTRVHPIKRNMLIQLWRCRNPADRYVWIRTSLKLVTVLLCLMSQIISCLLKVVSSYVLSEISHYIMSQLIQHVSSYVMPQVIWHDVMSYFTWCHVSSNVINLKLCHVPVSGHVMFEAVWNCLDFRVIPCLNLCIMFTTQTTLIIMKS